MEKAGNHLRESLVAFLFLGLAIWAGYNHGRRNGFKEGFEDGVRMTVEKMDKYVSDQIKSLEDEEPLEGLYQAIRQVETGGSDDPMNAVGDGGRSLGPYQISKAYFIDSGVEGKYDDVRYEVFAKNVMFNYWMRYCPQAVNYRDYETLARTHVGGPQGPEKESTKPYWEKVESIFKEKK